MSANHERRLRALEAQIANLRSAGRPLITTGTWTPTYYGGSSAGITTYTTQVGEYTQIADWVMVWGVVGWSGATGTGDGQFTLPFTARSTASAQYPVTLRVNGLAFGGAFINAVVTAGNDFFVCQSVAATTGAATTIAVDTAGILAFSVALPV